VAFLAAVFCALLGNLERFESLKASPSGIEAKTREVVERAESTISELRQLAATIGRILIELIISEGRWGGNTLAEKDQQVDELVTTLRAVGVSEREIDDILQTRRRWDVIDYVNMIMQRLGKAVVAEKRVEWNSFVKERCRGFVRPGPDELRKFLTAMGVLDDAASELIEDYRHYLATGKHRRSDVWARREELLA
jgi:hypothetical protein